MGLVRHHLRGAADCLCQTSVKCLALTWVVLGFVCRVPELDVKVHPEDGVVAVVPRDWGETQVQIKGSTEVMFFAHWYRCSRLLCGFVSLLDKDSGRMNQ